MTAGRVRRYDREFRGPSPRRREAVIDRTFVIYWGLLAIAALLTMRRPATAAGVLLCTYALEQWTQSQSVWFFQRQAMTNIATAGLVGFAILVRFQKGLPVFAHLGRTFWTLIGLFAYMAASVLWSVSPADTIDKFRQDGPFLLAYTVLMPLTIGDRRDLRDALYAVLGFGSVLAILLLTTSRWGGRSIQFETGSVFVIDGLSAGNPLAIGTFGGYLMLVALLLNYRGGGRFWQVLRYAIVALGFFVTVRSGSRGQTLAAILAAVAMLPLSRRFRNFGGFLAFAFSTALLASLIVVLFEYAIGSSADAGGENYLTRWSFEYSVNEVHASRFETALTLLNYWLASGPVHWVLGIGSSGSFVVPGIWFYCHFVPAEFLGELGLIGAAIGIVLINFVQRDARALWVLVRDEPETRGLYACLVSLLVFDFIVSLKQGSIINSPSLWGLAILLGQMRGFVQREAEAAAEADAGGYEMSDEERLLEDVALDDADALPQPA